MVCLFCILRSTNLIGIRGTLTGQRFMDEVVNPKVQPISRTVGNTFLSHWIGIADIILPMLSYPGCHAKAVYIVVF